MSAADNEAAEAAVSCRLSIIKHLDRPDFGRDMGLAIIGMGPEDDLTQDDLENGDKNRHIMLSMVVEADTWIAEDDVCDLVNSAAPEYPGSTIIASDILSPTGMVYFNKPISDPGNYDVQYPVRAIAWNMVGLRSPELDIVALKPMIMMIGYTDMEEMAKGKKIDLSNYPSVYPMISILWEIGSVDGGEFLTKMIDAETLESRRPYIKALMTYWAVHRQRLIESEEVKSPPRQRQISHAKKKRPQLNTNIQIVRRRGRTQKPRKTSKEIPEQLFDGPSKKKLDFSYGVGPHWRRAKPGSDEYSYIEGFINGNRDMPVRHVERVFAPAKARPAPKERES